MIKCGNPEIAKILAKLTDAEMQTLTKHLTRMILSYLIEKVPGNDGKNPLTIQVMKLGRKKILGEDSETLSIRITKKQKESIDLLVSQGKYKDLSSFVRQAIDGHLGIEWLR